MDFTEDEIKEIENTAALIPGVAKLWAEHKLIQEDSGKKFYTSLLNTVNSLTKELDSVSTGSYSKKRLLESDSKVWKRVNSLLVNSKKILAGLDAGKALMTPEKKAVVEKEIKQLKEEAQEEEMSLTDRLANKKGK